MSEWITDRLPTWADGLMIYGPHGKLCCFTSIATGEAWKPIPKCEPYVKPKRWGVVYLHDTNEYCVVEYNRKPYRSYSVPTREAAERIAAIYEEVMP